MGRRTFLVSAALAPLALSLGGCGEDQFPDYRYKMTIYARGTAFSSVRGIEQREVRSIVDSAGSTVKRTLAGEAVIIDLDGRTYYALLSKPDNADYATLIAGAALAPYIPTKKPQTEAEAAASEYREDKRREADPGYYLTDMAARSRAMTEVKGAKDLPRTLPSRLGKQPFQAWPIFVTLDDPDDPRTVREVRPEAIGVERITIEITDEDVTKGIEKKFGWWNLYKGKRFDGTSEITQDMTTSDLRNWLTVGQFSTGAVE